MSQASVIVSSFNQAAALKESLRALLNQDSPDTEILVVDHGSTDDSLDLIRSYASRLAYWSSAGGSSPVDDLNRAFASSKGQVLAWLNADDLLFPWTLRLVSFVFERLDVEWLTSTVPYLWTQDRLVLADRLGDAYSRRTFLEGANLPGSPVFAYPVWRASTFWSRSLWEKSGECVTAPLTEAGDFELWARFWQYAVLTTIYLPLGGRRALDRDLMQSSEYRAAAAAALGRYAGQRTAPLSLIKARRMLAAHAPALKRRWGATARYIWRGESADDLRVNQKLIL